MHYFLTFKPDIMKIRFSTFVAFFVLAICVQLTARAEAPARIGSSGIPGKVFKVPVKATTPTTKFMGGTLVETLVEDYSDDYVAYQTHHYGVEFSGTLDVDATIYFTITYANSEGVYDESPRAEFVSAGNYYYDIGTFTTYWWEPGITATTTVSFESIEEM